MLGGILVYSDEAYIRVQYKLCQAIFHASMSE